MRGTRARLPLIGALNGRRVVLCSPESDAAGFAPLLSLPGWDRSNLDTPSDGSEATRMLVATGINPVALAAQNRSQ